MGCEGKGEEPTVVKVGPRPKPNPVSRRFAFCQKSFFPIWTSNLRDTFRRKRKKKLGKGMSGAGGLNLRHYRGSLPRSRTWEGGTHPLFMRVPKWPAAAKQQKKHLESLNLAKLRYFIERGRLDTRFPSGTCTSRAACRRSHVASPSSMSTTSHSLTR